MRNLLHNGSIYKIHNKYFNMHRVLPLFYEYYIYIIINHTVALYSVYTYNSPSQAGKKDKYCNDITSTVTACITHIFFNTPIILTFVIGFMNEVNVGCLAVTLIFSKACFITNSIFEGTILSCCCIQSLRVRHSFWPLL